MGVKEAVKFAHDHAFGPNAWTERPPGSNDTQCWIEYDAIYGVHYNGQPWCGASNCVVIHHGGRTAPPQFISVNALYQWGVQLGRFHRISSSADVNSIKAGDLLIIGSPSEHEEFAMENGKNGQVLAHGGNTSPGKEGNQFNGGAEAIKYRSDADLYGYVVYHDLLDDPKKNPGDAPVIHHKEQPQYKKEAKTGDLHLWTTGPRVAELQDLLGIQSDGYYGRSTADKVNQVKKNHPKEFNNTDGTVASDRFINFLKAGVKPPKPALPTLKPGDISGMVGKLQRRLNAKLPGENLKVSNHFGSYTEDAVNKVRNHLKLHPNGVADKHVWDYIS